MNTSTFILKSNIPTGEKTAAIGGGGYVTGIYLHPQQQNLVYAKTDVGGFYRFNSISQDWIPLTDHFSFEQSNYYGGEALALDPSNPNIVYIAAGKYTADWAGLGTIFKSTNQGTSWTKLSIDLKMGGNENYRWLGERLAVNPANSSQLLFGSRMDGLWRSSDAGTNWSQIAFPGTLVSDVGITAIAFSPVTAGLVYAVAYDDGIYKSTDAGLTWTKMTGSPAKAKRMAVASNDTLYVSCNPGVCKFAANTWTVITPPGRTESFVGLAVNPTNPSQVIAAVGEQPSSHAIFLSNNAGSTWSQISLAVTNASLWRSDYLKSLPSISAIEFDPFSSNKAWISDWFGVWQTDNINASSVIFDSKEKGIEQVVVFALSAPPQGAYLLSGVADVDGFVHNRGLSEQPTQVIGASGVSFQDTYGIDYCKANPLKVVRVGSSNRTVGTGAVSNDGGTTWTQFASFPAALPTRVAVSATDPNCFVVLLSNQAPVFTLDNGTTWATCTGLPSGFTGPWNWSQPLCSDAVNGNTFYFYKEGTVYKSVNKGATWTTVNTILPWEYNWCSLKSTGGELWIALGAEGIYRSVNNSNTFNKVSSVTKARLFDFGCPKPGTTTPITYLCGTVSGLGSGFFSSPDMGETWLKLGTKTIGDDPNCLEASSAFYGLFFVGTNGRGIYYGNA